MFDIDVQLRQSRIGLEALRGTPQLQNWSC
jgi:hypothetical protein